ncbi:MAG: 23S rRNA (guanosine(2251)-2'-O)-methyltransferase RlmB [Marinilabiliaceae bacterium]|nr:23S rRNA (guanosine(2251)-2'-O)-methyltransferase RlmB [Marinilabiliaceae bacterium]
MEEKENYIFGIRAIQEAIIAGKEVDKIIARKGLNGELFGQLQKLCNEKRIRIQYTEAEVLDRITTGNHQGVVALMSAIEYLTLEELIEKLRASDKTPLLLMLDGVTDVRNFGAIVRTAHCAGVQGIIVPTKGSAPINGESVKTSAGALHHMPICKSGNLYLAVKMLKGNGIQVVCVTEHGADDYYSVDLKKPTLLIMGSEDKGISNQLLKLADARACIPMEGSIESLNVSVAAGILLFETKRQRTK